MPKRLRWFTGYLKHGSLHLRDAELFGRLHWGLFLDAGAVTKCLTAVRRSRPGCGSWCRLDWFLAHTGLSYTTNSCRCYWFRRFCKCREAAGYFYLLQQLSLWLHLVVLLIPQHRQRRGRGRENRYTKAVRNIVDGDFRLRNYRKSESH